MRAFLKMLAVIALTVVGWSSVASAHGGMIHDGQGSSSSFAARSFGHQAPRTTLAGETVIEASNVEAPSSDCAGSCCCQGLSHCSSSCGAPSALNDASVAAHDLTDIGVKVRAFLGRIASLDRKFGLERPPRA